ncbi:TfuA-like protein [Neorhizobium alkalisoli]|uniref:TfuA-like core domain-containing protein n=1 Tax=Neorhizobium alkalisoli TaxID=528178 RepID=A0A561Q0Z8_9HYPH|nr:TfuA-like protein [Neorhizobium alkalisoli]TWF44027.1 hypothetical protein FHW37_11631 [Neorhizobium alkalisoli]
MKVVFVGPSLADAPDLARGDLIVRPPACQGDVMKCLAEGATAIGLIDGQFEHVAPVWHKELIFALSMGVSVFGAASMGALRAAECHPFGMVGLGRIFEDYLHGRRDDDADVALLYGPSELGYPPISVPIVNVDATLETALQRDVIDPSTALALSDAARSIFFKDRTWQRIASVAGVSAADMRAWLRIAWTDQKRCDALLLIDTIRSAPPPSSRPSWTFNSTPLWRELYGQ